jgi:hypothetical protein
MDGMGTDMNYRRSSAGNSLSVPGFELSEVRSYMSAPRREHRGFQCPSKPLTDVRGSDWQIPESTLWP